MAKVSIILTSFNHASYIKEAVDSVLRQSFSDFELFIWDDASTDRSWDIIESFSDSRIKSFRNPYTMRGAFGINKVITELATGEYIAIHHSDDIWQHDKIEKQLNFLESNKKCAALFTAVKAVDEKGDILNDENNVYFSIFNQENRSRYEWLNRFFYHGNSLCHPSVMVRKACYDEVGVYDRRFGSIPDLELWTRICLKYDIHILPEQLVMFRVLPKAANASGHRTDNIVRESLERVLLLDRFRVISHPDEFEKIFPQYNFSESTDQPNLDYLLARTAIDVDSDSHRFFGINLLYSVMNSPETAKQLEKLYNFTYKDLVELAGTIDVFHFSDIAFFVSRLEYIRSSWAWKALSPLRVAQKQFNSLFRYFSEKGGK